MNAQAIIRRSACRAWIDNDGTTCGKPVTDVGVTGDTIYSDDEKIIGFWCDVHARRARQDDRKYGIDHCTRMLRVDEDA